MITLKEIESVQIISIDICCLICEKLIEKKESTYIEKSVYKVCPECEKTLHILKSI